MRVSAEQDNPINVEFELELTEPYLLEYIYASVRYRSQANEDLEAEVYNVKTGAWDKPPHWYSPDNRFYSPVDAYGSSWGDKIHYDATAMWRYKGIRSWPPTANILIEDRLIYLYSEDVTSRFVPFQQEMYYGFTLQHVRISGRKAIVKIRFRSNTGLVVFRKLQISAEIQPRYFEVTIPAGMVRMSGDPNCGDMDSLYHSIGGTYLLKQGTYSPNSNDKYKISVSRPGTTEGFEITCSGWKCYSETNDGIEVHILIGGYPAPSTLVFSGPLHRHSTDDGPSDLDYSYPDYANGSIVRPNCSLFEWAPELPVAQKPKIQIKEIW